MRSRRIVERSRARRAVAHIAVGVSLVAVTFAIAPGPTAGSSPAAVGEPVERIYFTRTECFASGECDDWRLWSIAPDGSDAHFVTRGNGGPSAPDHESVLTYLPEPDTVFQISPDGTNRRDLGSGRNPAWLPDGTEIMVSAGNQQIVRMNADGTNRQPVVDGELFGLSADGSEVFFVRTGPDGLHDIWRANSTGGDEVKIVDLGADDSYFVTVSPDDRVLFQRCTGTCVTPDVNSDLWTVARDGTDVRRMTNDTNYEGAARYSPDGSKIVFSRSTMRLDFGAYDLYTMDADGSNVSLLVGGATFDRDPHWNVVSDPAPPVDPTTVNLLANGSFETGGESLTPWIFRHDVAATLAVGTGDAVDGAQVAKVHVAATSTSTWLVQLRQENVRLQGANTYTVSFSAKASAQRRINARLQSPIAPYPTFIEKNFTLTPTWQRFTFEYTARKEIANAFVGFNLAQATGDVEIDHVTLTNNNLVANGGFEDAATHDPWIWRNDINATLTRDTNTVFDGTASAKVTVPTIGSAPHHVQLRQPVGPLWTRATYRVSLTIKASRMRSANVRLQSSDAPYPTVIETKFTVPTTWTRISFDWAPTTTVTHPFLGFNLAQDTGTIWLDDITLIQTGGPVAACSTGIPDGPAAFDYLAVASTTIHAGDVVPINFNLIGFAAETDAATLFYKGPNGVITPIDLLLYEGNPPAITAPSHWLPGRYVLVQVDNYESANPELNWGRQFRNHDYVGGGNPPVCGRSDLDLTVMDLRVLKP